MYRYLLFCVLSIALIATACDSDPTNTEGGADDTGVATDVATEDVADDADTSASDTGADTDPADTSTDVAEDAASDTSPDTGSPDAQTDASPDTGADPYAGRPLGQCTSDSDCPSGTGGSSCSEGLPGGACMGCGEDTHCPDGATCSQFGVCTWDCSTDEDCAPGLECTTGGRCAAMLCDNGQCPVALFGCNDSDRCARIECADDASVCPDGTTCTDGWCIEDRAL